MVIVSDVPLGGGVSSSAALTVATTLAMTNAEEGAVAPERIRHIAWTAENRFAGMPCGPLDQFASVFGRKGQALLMDCRTLSAEPVPLPADAAFLLVNSGVKHALVDGGYAQRRRECEDAAARLGVKVLRDADLRQIAALEAPLRQRARHVLTENARVGAVADALHRGDCVNAGRLVAESHQSLRADFDVTCPETDSLAAIANETPGVFGARQMGGGFGGCVIALVAADRASEAAAHIAETYGRRWNTGGDWFVCRTADGAGELNL
jgi:galactokinase